MSLAHTRFVSSITRSINRILRELQPPELLRRRGRNIMISKLLGSINGLLKIYHSRISLINTEHFTLKHLSLQIARYFSEKQVLYRVTDKAVIKNPLILERDEGTGGCSPALPH